MGKRVDVWRPPHTDSPLHFPTHVAESRQAKTLRAKKARGLLSTEVKRWHAHEVWCLAFSPDGAYLYSGGREAVLLCCQVQPLAEWTHVRHIYFACTGVSLLPCRARRR